MLLSKQEPETRRRRTKSTENLVKKNERKVGKTTITPAGMNYQKGIVLASSVRLARDLSNEQFLGYPSINTNQFMPNAPQDNPYSNKNKAALNKLIRRSNLLKTGRNHAAAKSNIKVPNYPFNQNLERDNSSQSRPSTRRSE
mmetsp:Transcript_15443/g.20892  ORF Transcript_15443/g.20892 Transcript_15443/m.20892 type:complete len:142 (-) Transcript_15443:264-689(-)